MFDSTSRELDRQLATVNDRLYRHCLRLTNNRREDAEDLKQDVCIQAVRYHHTFVCFTGKESHAFARWCEVIATNMMWNRRHRGKPSVETVSFDQEWENEALLDTQNPEDIVVGEDVVERFFKMLNDKEKLAVMTLMDPEATRVDAAEASGLTYRQVQKLQQRMRPVVAALTGRDGLL